MAKRAKKGIEIPELILGARYRIRVMGVSIVAKCMSKPVTPGSKMKIGFVIPGAGMRDDLLYVKASDVVCRVPDQTQPGAAHIHDATVTRESMKPQPQPGQWWHVRGRTIPVLVLNRVDSDVVCWYLADRQIGVLVDTDFEKQTNDFALTTKQAERVAELMQAIGPRNGWEAKPIAPKVRSLVATMTVYIPGVLKPSDPGAAQRSLEARWCKFEEAVKKAGGRPDAVQVDWAP